ncbi:MAG TPA: adenosine deaminase [Candidatus Babeliales bacterium]|nr:adenosine deaminase [Candidatus Babeliales bacterium]
MNSFLKKLPKAELHVHLEGTIAPELMFIIADRNKVKLSYKTENEVRNAYNFKNYDEFARAYRMLTSIMRTEQDFYDVARAYAKRAHAQGVLHLEMTFDFDTYLPRAINPGIIVNGIYEAFVDARRDFGISTRMILCLLRHLDETVALNTLKLSIPYKDKIIAIGLASDEPSNPPSKFKKAFSYARELGYRTTAHVGENAGPENIWRALDLLKVDRIDHGVRCFEDEKLVNELIKRKMPITVCPISNIKTGLFKTAREHPLKRMLDAGLLVSINSDDPVFFGGELLDNYQVASNEGGLSQEDLITCARNSFVSAFISDERKNHYLKLLNEAIKTN